MPINKRRTESWQRYAASVLTMASREVFRPVVTWSCPNQASAEDQKKFAQSLADMGVTTVIHHDTDQIEVSRPNVKEIAKMCAELADAMWDEENAP